LKGGNNVIIMNDFTNISDSLELTKCTILNRTVLLEPSEVNGYLGSVESYEMLGRGIILNPGDQVDVVCKDIDDLERYNWCIIIFNNKYYYVLYKDVDIDTIRDESLNIGKICNNNPIAKAAAGASAEATLNRLALYNEPGTFKLMSVNFGCKTYAYPDRSKGFVSGNYAFYSLKKGAIIQVQSKWESTKDGKKEIFYGTCTGLTLEQIDAGVTGYVSEFDLSPIETSSYYGVLNSFYQCYILNGSNEASTYTGYKYNKHDVLYPLYYKNDHFYCCQKFKNNVIAYTVTKTYLTKVIEHKVGNTVYVDQSLIQSAQVTKPPTECRLSSLSTTSAFALKSDSISDFINGAGTASGSSSKIRVGEKVIILCNATETSYLVAKEGYLFILDKNCLTKENGIKTDDNPYNSSELPGGYTTSASLEEPANTAESYEGNDTSKWKSSTSNDGNPIYKINVPDAQELNIDQVPGIVYGKDLPPSQTLEDSYILDEALSYELARNPINDTRQISKINRFRLLGDNTGLSTKSFVFMTRPNLNLWEKDKDTNKLTGGMNEDLKKLPTFKYIARLGELGNNIMRSLSYWAIGTLMPTPWLSVISNQATGYAPIDKKMDFTEVGETFHGSKLFYAKANYEHKIADTITIPFNERRDLSLYYTLRMWIDYMNAIYLGFAKPYKEHFFNNELDYAVALYYITTDETMENILYWEKLTGVFPLLVPDSFFNWESSSTGKDMTHNIPFAYSFRTTMDEFHLAEINSLYNYGEDCLTYEDKNFIYDKDTNKILARLATSRYFNNNNYSDADVNALNANQAQLEKFYYTTKTANNYDDEGYARGTVTSSLLPNYIVDNKIGGMHGVPYVKGPFITLDKLSGKHKLGWV
jgi:hypothetical protein